MVVVGLLLAVLWTAADFVALVLFYRWAGFYAAAALILGSAVLGVALFRWQMRGILQRLKSQLTQASLPGAEAAEGLLLFLAACLMVAPFPGMDTVGLLLMFAPLRRFLARRIRNWVSKRFEPGPGSFVFQMGGVSTQGWSASPFGPGAGMTGAEDEGPDPSQGAAAGGRPALDEDIEEAQVRPAEPADGSQPEDPKQS